MPLSPFQDNFNNICSNGGDGGDEPKVEVRPLKSSRDCEEGRLSGGSPLLDLHEHLSMCLRLCSAAEDINEAVGNTILNVFLTNSVSAILVRGIKKQLSKFVEA